MQVEREAFFGMWAAADGLVTRGKLPSSGGQPLETMANTAYALRGKDLSLLDVPALD